MDFIKLFRRFKETSFFKNSHCVHLAIYLLLECNWKDNKIIFNKEELIIKRGQCITGRKKIAIETGMSQQNVRTALNILQKVKFLTSKSTNKFTIISIDNYTQYQTNINQQSNQQVTNNQPTSNQQLTTLEERKKDKNDKKTENDNDILSNLKDKKTIKDNNIVNWDTCKTNIQRIMKFYISTYCPDLYVGYTNKEYAAFVSRNGKAISGILDQCRDNIDIATQVIKDAGAYFSKKGLDWSLYAVDRNCTDYVNEIKRRQNYATPTKRN